MPDPRSASKVSVIIPAHNQAAFIGAAIDSVMSQSEADWECIVVDDGSSDDTGSVTEDRIRRDRRIRLVSQPNAGPSAARNLGLRMTSAPLVQFLDADDVLGPRKLELHSRILSASPSVDLVYGRARYFTGLGSDPPQPLEWIKMPARQSPSGRGVALVTAILEDNIMVVEAPLIRRTLFESAGAFDPVLRSMEDWELWLRFALKGAAFHFEPTMEPDACVFVRIHDQNASRDTTSMLRSELAIRDRLSKDLADPQLLAVNRRRRNAGRARIGVLEGARGNVALGMRELVGAARDERRTQWLVMAVALPALRLPLMQRAINFVRGRLGATR